MGPGADGGGGGKNLFLVGIRSGARTRDLQRSNRGARRGDKRTGHRFWAPALDGRYLFRRQGRSICRHTNWTARGAFESSGGAAQLDLVVGERPYARPLGCIGEPARSSPRAWGRRIGGDAYGGGGGGALPASQINDLNAVSECLAGLATAGGGGGVIKIAGRNGRERCQRPNWPPPPGPACGWIRLPEGPSAGGGRSWATGWAQQWRRAGKIRRGRRGRKSD